MSRRGAGCGFCRKVAGFGVCGSECGERAGNDADNGRTQVSLTVREPAAVCGGALGAGGRWRRGACAPERTCQGPQRLAGQARSHNGQGKSSPGQARSKTAKARARGTSPLPQRPRQELADKPAPTTAKARARGPVAQRLRPGTRDALWLTVQFRAGPPNSRFQPTLPERPKARRVRTRLQGSCRSSRGLGFPPWS